MRCKKCGWPNKINDTVCVKCGAPLVSEMDEKTIMSPAGSMQQPTPNQAPGQQAPSQSTIIGAPNSFQPQQQAPSGQAESNFNPKSTIPEGVFFGQNMQQPAPNMQGGNYAPAQNPSAGKPQACPTCGYPIRSGADKCPNCKTPLTGSQPNMQPKPEAPRPAPQQPKPQQQAAPIPPQPKAQPAPQPKPQPAPQNNINNAIKMNPADNKSPFKGTVNPYLQNVQLEPMFSLKPIARVDERHVPAPQTYEGASIVLNRQNTEPANESITSKQQAVVSFDNGHWFIEDKSTLKTTFVQASRRMELQEGDIILLGDRLFQFHIQ